MPCFRGLPAVIKARQRVVVSLRFGTIRYREVLRPTQRTGQLGPSGLGSFVAPGMRYAHDLVAHVGVAYDLQGKTLASIQQELRQRTPTSKGT